MNTTAISSILSDPTLIRRRKWRMLKDKLTKYGMTVGGISIIIAILLIFFYLLYVVFPIFLPAHLEKVRSFKMLAPTAGETVYLATEEKSEVGVRFTRQGHAVQFKLDGSQIIADNALAPVATTVTSFAIADPATGVVAFGLNDGRAIVVQQKYEITYGENNVRVIKPRLDYPLGEAPVVIDEKGQALLSLDLQLGENSNTFVAVTADNRLLVSTITKETSFLDDSVSLTRTHGELPLQQAKITHLLLEKEQRVLYAADKDGQVWYISLKDKTAPQVLQRVHVVQTFYERITALEFLTGDISLLVGDSSGRITQWFLVRDNNNNNLLTKIREFHDQQSPIVAIAAEERRKGFIAADSSGQVGIYHATAQRTLLVEPVTEDSVAISQLGLAPRADTLLVEDVAGNLHIWAIQNEHPEVSWSTLWNKVWYENYAKPEYLWQSSAATNDFEPKFSLMPLAFGTLKAAFYAMLIAVPIAVFGAIYTAYFMAPSIRRLVKPTIEIMAALPTVILGFLAGLWLAPMLENNLLAIVILFILLPTGVLLFAYAWQWLPKTIRYRIPTGWEAALLMPVVLGVIWSSSYLKEPLETWLFHGDIRHWLTHDLGIRFDQRNALVVGIAMGFAVIPNIFSIAEDAVFSVPKHLTIGSLALGATPWQTMTRVVILTASPGIFSAVMIGMGRAVGETMIVLMATGNTPVMEWNIFEGLRTLAANIAVEMPESEVNGTHFRVLFLSALVLFIFTFFFNTLSEVIRQRLRKKYSSL